ncbi:polysaccharide deacetylase family protein [Pontibacter rugosus]|uniref:Polysaccharide deacetylase family protein n=1 Tax=Pontibacter rugosus TaxID=1745966 RepID=A0ABW3SVW1_9BACT
MAKLDPDVWNLGVSPEHFEEQLQLLSSKWRVIPLPDLTDDILANRLRRNCIALSFDDGYIDNFLEAKPLLEKYKLPATFFVSSGNIGQQTAFWWDVLEQVFLHMEPLPPAFNMPLKNTLISVELTAEQYLTESIKEQHRQWKAYVQPPPTARARLFLRVWEVLRPLPHSEQQECLGMIMDWAGAAANSCSHCLSHSMSREQLQELSNNRLFCLGGHSVSHPDLAAHITPVQRQEILQNKQFLEEVSQKQVRTLAYPYGSYNSETMAVAAEAGFTAAFTTDQRVITPGSDPFRLGRFLVGNWPAEELHHHMKQWLKT